MAKAAEKTESKYLTYKDRPLIRRGNLLYYGNHDDKYIVALTIQESTNLIDLDIATNVLVALQTNEAPGKERIIKKAERDGLYAALDLGEYWLTEILSEE